MSKKIDAALKELTKALKKHAEVVSGPAVSLKQAQRAAAKVSVAAATYAEVVDKKAGVGNPFDDLLKQGLEGATLESLKAEREKIKNSLTGPVTVVTDSE